MKHINYTIYTILIVFALAVSGFVYAHEEEVLGAIVEEAAVIESPTFIGRFFEGVGTFFTFGNTAKIARYLTLAERRLAEAQTLTQTGDFGAADAAVDAVSRFEAYIARAKERARRTDIQGTEKVAERNIKHIETLDRIIEQVPDEAKDALRAVRTRAVDGHIELLRTIAEEDPGLAVHIFSRAGESRLRAAEVPGETTRRESFQRAESRLKDYEKYAEFGREISTVAHGIQVGEATVDELVSKAGEHHLEVLREVRLRLPSSAQDEIDRAIKNAEFVRDTRPLDEARRSELEAARAKLLETISSKDDARAEEQRKNKTEGTMRSIAPVEDDTRFENSFPYQGAESRINVEPKPIQVSPIIIPMREEQETDEAARLQPPSLVPAQAPVSETSGTLARADILIEGFAFSPASVRIPKGTTVVWTNHDRAGHTVTGGDGRLNSRLLGYGESYSFTFNTPGTYSYICASHPYMRGSVTILP